MHENAMSERVLQLIGAHPLECLIWQAFEAHAHLNAILCVPYLSGTSTPEHFLDYQDVAQDILDHMLQAGRLARDSQGWYIKAR